MLRMRQICLVASDLDAVERDLSAAFGIEVCHRDTGVANYGLHNFLMPIGDGFLEVVSPLPGRDDTAGARYIERRGGDGGYMVIMQCGDFAEARERVTGLGIRLVLDGGGDTNKGVQLHPKDVPAAIVELRWNANSEAPYGPWGPAGDDWQGARHEEVVTGMVAAELQTTDDPATLAARWSEVVDRPTGTDTAGNPTIELDAAVLRFVEATDGRGPGLGGLDLAVADRDHVMAAAAEHGFPVDGDVVTVCGTRFRLV
jgi:hypothetical protein